MRLPLSPLPPLLCGFSEKSGQSHWILIVPVPPSDTGRRRQPVLEVAEQINGMSGIEISQAGVTKIKQTQQLKNVYDYKERMALLRDAFAADASSISAKRVLLFDELFRSGATMNTITGHLIEDGKAKAVYALTLTRTRSSL
jgi:competence protein ComFC